MATVLRYVNTNSTAGGDGTTNAITGVSRAYVDLAEWEAAEQTDLVAAGDIAEVICSGGADVSNIGISGWVTSATSYILIHATTDKHGGVFDSGKYYFEGDSVSTRFRVAQGYVYIEDLQFTRPTPAASGADRPVISWASSVGVQYVRRSIFKFDSNDIAGTVGAFAFDSSTPDYVITDNIFDNRLASGGTNDICITGLGASADALIYNNTFINWSLAINSRANYIVKNNIFQDCTDDITGTLNANNNYNLTDNTSIAGANSVANSTLTFDDKAAFNFALASGDTDAIGAGIGPSADGNVSLTDAIGTARVGATTDIGAFVFVGGGGGTSVTVDIDIRNQVLSAIYSDVDIRNQILVALTSVISDLDIRNSICSRVLSNVDVRNSILTSTTSNVDIRNSILSSAFNDTDIRSSILSAVWSDVDIRNKILAAAGYVISDLDVRNAISGAVVSDVDVRNQILVSISNDIDLRNKILQSITKDVDVRTSILASTYKDVDYRNCILGAAYIDVDIRNGIDGIRATRNYSFSSTEQNYSLEEQDVLYSFTTQNNQYSF